MATVRKHTRTVKGKKVTVRRHSRTDSVSGLKVNASNYKSFSNKSLSVGDRIIAKRNSFYKGIESGTEYEVIKIYASFSGIEAYMFKRVGKSDKPVGNHFSHDVRSIDGSLGNTLQKVNKTTRQYEVFSTSDSRKAKFRNLGQADDYAKELLSKGALKVIIYDLYKDKPVKELSGKGKYKDSVIGDYDRLDVNYARLYNDCVKNECTKDLQRTIRVGIEGIKKDMDNVDRMSRNNYKSHLQNYEADLSSYRMQVEARDKGYGSNTEFVNYKGYDIELVPHNRGVDAFIREEGNPKSNIDDTSGKNKREALTFAKRMVDYISKEDIVNDKFPSSYNKFKKQNIGKLDILDGGNILFRYFYKHPTRDNLTVDVFKYDNNDWRATVNNSYIDKEISKARAVDEAFKYMKRMGTPQKEYVAIREVYLNILDKRVVYGDKFMLTDDEAKPYLSTGTIQLASKPMPRKQSRKELAFGSRVQKIYSNLSFLKSQGFISEYNSFMSSMDILSRKEQKGESYDKLDLIAMEIEYDIEQLVNPLKSKLSEENRVKKEKDELSKRVEGEMETLKYFNISKASDMDRGRLIKILRKPMRYRYKNEVIANNLQGLLDSSYIKGVGYRESYVTMGGKRRKSSYVAYMNDETFYDIPKIVYKYTTIKKINN